MDPSEPRTIQIAGRPVGPGHLCFLIAEAGVNHNGDVELAKRLIDAAVTAGADAVKFQTFKSESVIAPSAPKADYQVSNTGNAESQLEMVKRLELPFEAFRQLEQHCKERKVLFLSTPFDAESADFLASLGMAAFKIPSGEITNLPFLEHIAAKAKPIILSTGMSTLAEVSTAVRTLEQAGTSDLVVLHCVSDYPARPSSVNLRAMKTMASTLGRPVGYSDHTLGIEVALAAVALGACVIEKHFTLDRKLPGPDHPASLEPSELAALVRGVRIVESALGDGVKRPQPEELSTAAVARRSLVAARDIPAGTILSVDSIAILRPGTGLPPARRAELIGRRTRCAISSGTLLRLEMIE